MRQPWADVGPDSPGGRLLRQAWQPVYRSIDLVPGQVVTVRLLDEAFTLFRGESGAAHLLADRCPHRGTHLGVGRVLGDRVECAHHGWCWRGSGEADPQHEAQLTAVGVQTWPVVEALGLVFVWLGEGTPPPLPEVPRGPWTPLLTNRWPCSFFRRLENSLDLGHLPHSHRVSGVGGGMPGDLAVESRRFAGGIEASTPDVPVPPVRFYLPNLLLFSSPAAEGGGWTDHLVWRVPEGPDSCRSFTVANAEVRTERREHPFQPTEVEQIGDRVLAGDATLDGMRGHRNLTEVEDYVVLVGQGPIATSPPDHLGPADQPIRHLRACWREAVGQPIPRHRIEPLPC